MGGVQIWARLREWAGIDLRTLAVFRIFLAISVLAEVSSYLPHLEFFFSDSGVYPRADSMGSASLRWSLYYVSGHWLWALVLLVTTYLAAAALLVGYRTRLATLVCWVLVVSLEQRAGMLTSGADMQLKLLLFWAMFVPLGARLSVDAGLSKQGAPQSSYASIVTLALMVQVACLYFFGALLKTGATWRETHDAVYYSLHANYINTPLASYVGNLTDLLRWLTVYVFHLELFIVALLFFPVATGLLRLIALPFLISLHIGFALFLSIGIFPLVSITGLMVFIPGLVWNFAIPRFNSRASRRGIAIFYDRDCDFCRKTCNIFCALSLPESTSVDPAQNDPEINRILERENSWVVRDARGNYRTRWDAVAYVWRRSPLLWPLGYVFLPSLMHPLGDRLYDLIARNRGALGRLTAVLLPERGTAAFRPHLATQAVLLLLLVGVVAWNMQNLSGPYSIARPDWFKQVFQALKLTQHWNMFASNSPRRTIWVVIEGQRSDGSKIDLLRGGASSLERPAHGYQAFSDFRMRKFFTRVSLKRKRTILGRFFCRKWNDEGQDMALVSVTLYRFSQATPPPGGYVDNAPVQRTIHHYECS